MKIGIYIDGLGQSVAQQSVVEYATRLKNEFDSHTDGIFHELKVAKINYTNDCQSNVVSLIEKKEGQETVLYKLYDFRYGEILTNSFSNKNILVKNILLFIVVITKLPVVFKRFFKHKNYNRPFQTFYIFLLFLIIATAILFMVPATLTLISNFLFAPEIVTFIHAHPFLLNIVRFFGINQVNFKHFSEMFVSIIAIILLLVPQANTIITSLATEFVCAHHYLQYGQQKQEILGNIDRLVEYISEHETDTRLHFHTYSYGSLIAMDYLFPFGKKPSGNMLTKSEALITIGTPFDFISSYYSNYFVRRSSDLESKIKWLNVYSVADALGSNFRNDTEAGEAEYGLSQDGLKPININYEVMKLNEQSLTNFIMLNSLKVHAMYWPKGVDGQSCVNLIYSQMKSEGLF